jgi:general stress protein 26
VKTEEIKKGCIELIETAPAVYVSSIGEGGYPHTRSLFNLRNKEQFPSLAHLFEGHQDDFMTYFSTNTSSSKLRQIIANPKVSLYYCKPEQFLGLMLAGDMEIVKEHDIKKALWVEGWERYYPSGRHDPDYTVLRIYPKFTQGWYGSFRYAFRLDDKLVRDG